MSSPPRAAVLTRPNLREAPIAVLNTAVTAGGCALGILPVGALFSDNRWYMEALGAIILMAAPAAVLRWRRPPRALQLVPGAALVLLYVTTLYLHKGSLFGTLPGSGTVQRLRDLQAETRAVVRSEASPLASTAGLRLYLIPSAAALTALTDWLANVRRSPALAGVGFLATFTIVGAIRGGSVGWWQFVAAAIGYLLVLLTASRRETAEWGRIVPRVGQGRVTRLRLAASGARIGSVAVILAIVVPVLVPGLNRNLLLDYFHNGPGGNGPGNVTLSAFVGLAGQLREHKTTKLWTAHVTGGSREPFYFRQAVLDQYTNGGWRPGNPGTRRQPTPYVLQQLLDSGSASAYSATIKILSFGDDAPLFGQPRQFHDLRGDWEYDTSSEILAGSVTRHNETYTEDVAEPNPSPDELRVAKPGTGTLQGSDQVPDEVRRIVNNVVVGKQGAYDKVLALLGYFSPQNGFSYSLKTKTGDTGSALLDFLHNRVGFCQQYAAAMAIMLRVAGVPSRVVLGATHGKFDSDGNVTVTNHDLHAWVEVQFDGIGWVPFDPTPLSSSPADAGRAAALPWASPAAGASASQSSTTREPSASQRNPGASGQDSSSASASAGSGRGKGVHVPVGFTVAVGLAAVLAALLSIRPGLRLRQRSSRWRRARQQQSLAPVWQELRASATDAGHPWPVRTTPRQLPRWLGEQGVVTDAALQRFVAAAEREFYAGAAASSDGFDETLSEAIGSVQLTRRQLLALSGRRHRARLRMWPASMSRRRGRSAALTGKH